MQYRDAVGEVFSTSISTAAGQRFRCIGAVWNHPHDPLHDGTGILDGHLRDFVRLFAVDGGVVLMRSHFVRDEDP